ncbi:hypothetical protein C8R48DRAFT_545912, partial [Suillus tomentosus]
FSDAFQYPPCTANTTITQLKSIKSTCDPQNIEAFFAAYELYHFSGVVDLFWCNWSSADLNWFLTPEAL